MKMMPWSNSDGPLLLNLLPLRLIAYVSRYKHQQVFLMLSAFVHVSSEH